MEWPRELPLFSPEECEGLRARVHTARSAWRQNDPVLPAYTLGVSTHYDAQPGDLTYRRDFRESNAFMLSHFGDVIERLRARLEEFLGDPVTLDDEHLAVPGFHIFGAHEGFRVREDPPHFDIHHLFHDLSHYGEVDAERTHALTMVVHAPSSGAGFRLWDVALEERLIHDRDELKRRRLRSTFEDYAYTPGVAAVHSGRTLHAILSPKEGRDDDERTSLQAHTIWADGRHVLFW